MTYGQLTPKLPDLQKGKKKISVTLARVNMLNFETPQLKKKIFPHIFRPLFEYLTYVYIEIFRG